MNEGNQVQRLRDRSLVGEGPRNQCLLHNHCDNADNKPNLFFSTLLSWWFVREINRRARIEIPSIFISTLKSRREMKE